MSIKEIKKYIELLKKEDLASLHYKNEEFEITLHAKQNHQPMMQSMAPVVESHSEPQESALSINAPLVGTFYAKPTPDSKPFVSVGDVIREGDVVCILESMKVMNEIKADKSGTVTKILVSDGDAVSYDQALFELS